MTDGNEYGSQWKTITCDNSNEITGGKQSIEWGQHYVKCDNK